MKSVNFSLKKSIDRRSVLKGVGATMALPFLSAMNPAFASTKKASKTPMRMIGVCHNLGFYPKNFFPEKAGKDYELTKCLTHLKDHRKDFTVFSGVSLPGVDGGHPADNVFLTAAPHPGSAGFRNSISLDQIVAERIGSETRFPSLTLGVNAAPGKHSLSWTRSGVLIPCENQAFNVYKKLFIQGSKKEIDKQVQKLSLGQSIMDTIAGQAKDFNKTLGKIDKERMDQYQTSVRELEKQMVNSSNWVKKQKPKFPEGIAKPDMDISNRDYFTQLKFMYSMAHLAFQTDSTRAISLMADSVVSPALNIDAMKITDSYHNISHHGKNKKKLAQHTALDEMQCKLLAEFIGKLKNTQEGEGRLIDNVMVLHGSNMGDAYKHVCTNMPIIFAGGPFKHGQHLVYDKKFNYPLSNLYVSMLQAFDFNIDKFVTSTGTMKDLERV